MQLQPSAAGFAAAVAATVLLAGCSSSGKARATSPSPPLTPPAGSATPSTGASSGPTVDPSAAPIAVAAPGSLPGVGLAVLSLARAAGDSVVGQFRVTNNGSEVYDIGPSFIDPAIFNPNNANDAGGISLIDTPNNKKYLVLLDSRKDCICSANLNRVLLKTGQSAVIYAQFPAPPTTTQAVQVFIPNFPPVNNVPIAGQ